MCHAPVLLIHGGAGTVRRSEATPALAGAIRAALADALHAGHAVLAAGGTAVDAVERAVRAMEDSPLFNAGRGAVYTADGTIELDAAIMAGSERRAGAVTGVRRVRNPVSLARAVMDHGPHVLLAGDGAEAYARAHGLETVEPSWFHTPERWEALQRLRRAGGSAALSERDRHGTVGAVALDAHGNLAAATSTGGRTGKLPGRVGDTPVPGAGTWADARVAVSGTGDGDVFLRCTPARVVGLLVERAGVPLAEAAAQALGEVEAHGGNGGLIALDAHGTWATPFDTEGMYRGRIGADGIPRVGVWREDESPLAG